MVSDERIAFEQALRQDEDDDITRMVFADWLDEHDMPEEADRMRRWRSSKTWLENWCRSVNYGNLGDPHTYEDAVEAGYAAAQGRQYIWGTDAAQDYFFRSDYSSVNQTAIREWLYHWSTVTGVPLDSLEHVVENVPFRCAC